MLLTPFLSDLFEKGQVSVAGQLEDFSSKDLQAASGILKNFYEEEALRMPFEAPAFVSEAAIWGARFIYRGIQFAMLRELEDQHIQRELEAYLEPLSPEVIGSVDLCMRYLPDLFSLAKGLAPDDILVQYLKKAASEWPFSSVGIDIPPESKHELILENPSLRQAYLDRILAAEDLKRVTDFHLIRWMKAIAGQYPSLLPKAFNHLLNEEPNITN